MHTQPFEPSLLLVDSDLDFLNWATKHLSAEGLRILRCDSPLKALKVLEKTEISVVLAALDFHEMSGIDFLIQAQKSSPECLILLHTTFPTTNQIIEATQRGAYDVLRRESLPFELRPVMESALKSQENRRGAPLLDATGHSHEGRVKIIGNSRPLQEVFKLVGRVAHADAPVLITGESGTGKELIAKAIHEYSDRRKNEILIINCGAIPENLLESELFGHEKGSFTGAIARREGRFEQANHGTLFLDEIGEMPLSVQVKLLRVLQDGSFSRIGSNEMQRSHARIIAATHKNLAAEVAFGRFREDLYYRLNVVEIRTPSLRERKEDIPLLAEFFLQRIHIKSQKPLLKISEEAINTLLEHDWPGNVRELENTIARGVALTSSPILMADDIHLIPSPKEFL